MTQGIDLCISSLEKCINSLLIKSFIDTIFYSLDNTILGLYLFNHTFLSFDLFLSKANVIASLHSSFLSYIFINY
jgi:hypothetical protein